MTKREYKTMREAQTKFLLNLMAREEAESKARREAQRAKLNQDKAEKAA
jgi:hypothetical protein